MIVVDTSVIAYLCLRGPEYRAASALLLDDPSWFAPPLWRSEFHNVLALHMRHRGMALKTANRLLGQAERILVNREVRPDSSRVLRLVADSNCSAYDCEFVALAQELSTSLVTSDERLVREFPETVVPLDSFSEN